MKQINEYNKTNRLIDTEQSSGYQWGEGKGRGGKIGVGD